ncbi:MAG: DGQHR domain-containing protein [Patescibacteria group bacterium]
MSHKLTIPAIEISQPGLGKNKHIYVASIEAKDLVSEAMFKVDVWTKDKESEPDQGYQRAINTKHATDITGYLMNDDSLLPGSILLSTRDYQPDFENGKLSLDKYPIFVVDGQHRLAGLRIALENDQAPQWADARLPVTILAGFSKFEEMVQFVEINTKAKKIITDLAMELMLDMSKNPEYKDKFIREGSDWKFRATKIVNELNRDTNGTWYNAIKVPGDVKNPKAVASLNSFVTSLKPLALGSFAYVKDVDKNIAVINTYWKAIRELFPEAFLEPKTYSIRKTPGLFPLHSLLQAILTKKSYDFGLSGKDLKELLKKIFEEADVDTDFWRSDKLDGVTMYGSMKGFRILADQLISAMNKVD